MALRRWTPPRRAPLRWVSRGAPCAQGASCSRRSTSAASMFQLAQGELQQTFDSCSTYASACSGTLEHLESALPIRLELLWSNSCSRERWACSGTISGSPWRLDWAEQALCQEATSSQDYQSSGTLAAATTGHIRPASQAFAWSLAYQDCCRFCSITLLYLADQSVWAVEGVCASAGGGWEPHPLASTHQCDAVPRACWLDLQSLCPVQHLFQPGAAAGTTASQYPVHGHACLLHHAKSMSTLLSGFTCCCNAPQARP